MDSIQESFPDRLRFIIKQGLMANLSGGVFKNYIVSLVQEHSKKMALDGEPLSPVFTRLCDFMIDGRFSKMPEKALKIYILKSVYPHLRTDKRALEIMVEMSGLPVAHVKQSIEYLNACDCFDPSERKRLDQGNITSFLNRESGLRKGKQHRSKKTVTAGQGSGSFDV